MTNWIKYLKERHDWKTLLFHSSWSLTLTSGLSYALGLLRDRTLAHTFGLSRALDIYNASFVIPEGMQNLLIGTVLSAAFIPIFVKQWDKQKTDGLAYMNQIMSWGLVVILIGSALSFVLMPFLTQYLVPGFEPAAREQYILAARLLLISPMLFTVSNIYGGVLNGFREFFWVGLSPALYNLGIVLGAVFLAPRYGVVGLMIGTLLGNLLHLIIRFVIIKRPKYEITTRADFSVSPEIRETLVLTAPKLIQYAMASAMLWAYTSIASNLGPGAVAANNYARNFQSVPVSLIGIAIAYALFPSLAHDAGRGDFKKFRADFRSGFARTIVYTTLAAAALAVTAKFVITTLLGGGKFTPEDVSLLALTLQIYCLSVPLESLMHTFHRAYYALKNTLLPSMVHTMMMTASIVAAYFLAPKIGVLAIPLSFAGGLLVHVTILGVLFPGVLRKSEKIFI